MGDLLTALAFAAVALSCFVAGRMSKPGDAPKIPRVLPGQRYRLQDGRVIVIVQSAAHGYAAEGPGIRAFVPALFFASSSMRRWLRRNHAEYLGTIEE